MSPTPFTGTAFVVVDADVLDPDGDLAPPDVLEASSAWAATDALREAFELTDADEEDADWIAQCAAAVAALQEAGPRGRAVVSARVSGVVPVAESPEDDDRDFGGLELDEVAWSQVTAVFLDEPAALDVVGEVARHVGDQALGDVWDDEVVQELLAEHPLLWYAPGEFE